MKLFRELFKKIQKKSLRDLSIWWKESDLELVEDKVDYIVNSTDNNEQFDAGYYEGQKNMIRVVNELLKFYQTPIDNIIEYLYSDEKKHSREQVGFLFDEMNLINAVVNYKNHSEWEMSGLVDIEDHIFVSVLKLKYPQEFVDMDLFKGYGIDI